jgi:hypothetical protein
MVAENEAALESPEAGEVDAKGLLIPRTWQMDAREAAVEKALDVLASLFPFLRSGHLLAM